jgi:hypothetical protein
MGAARLKVISVLILASLAVACGSTGGARYVPSSTILISGQSNAGNVAPFVVAAYYPSAAVMSAHGGEPIRKWAAGSPYWNELAPLLRHPLRAFVWWQGESDGDLQTPTYLADLTDLVARARATNGNPDLFVIIVRILPLPHDLGAGVRAAQEAFVKADASAVLVSSDGVPAQNDGYHLTNAGYRQVAARIVAALPRQ